MATATKVKFSVEKDPFDSSPKTLAEIPDQKWKDLAKENFDEDECESTTNEKISELRQKLVDLGIKLPRDDDLYLLKFLRAGNGKVEEALEVVKAYVKIMKDNEAYFGNIIPSKLDHVFGSQINSMTESRDKNGRRVYLYRPGKWNPSTTPFSDVFNAAFVMAEMISEEAKSQIAGVTVVGDAGDFGFKQLRNFGIRDAQITSAFFQTSFPLWFRSIHVVNAPKLFMVAFGVVKPFLSEYVKKNVHFHSTWDSLYEHVDREVLPEEMGGTAGKFDNSICAAQAKDMEQYFNDLKSTMFDKKQ